MSEINELIEKIIEFRRERDWEQFHTPKDQAISLMLEAAEVAEIFQWKNDKDINEYLKENIEELEDELADVLFWILIMSYDFKINLKNAFLKKLDKTAKRYPADKVRGSAKKYTEYKD